MSRVGGKILELKKIYKSYGDLEILKGFDHTFKKGERIGVVGKNGVGKSTFLNILTGLEKADSGKRNVGDNTVFGYYAQEGLQLKEDKKIIDVLKDYAEILTLADGRKLTASQFLNYFLFPPKMQQTLFSKLSGGEKRRFHLLTVLIQNPNFLILDEPTNDLDLVTLNKLEEFLESFQGCLILVSHDRYFMDKLVDQLFVFEGEGDVKGFIGTYSEYREIVEEEQKEIVQKEKQEKAENSPAKTRTTNKPSYKDKLEYETLEKELINLEKEKKELESNLNSGETDFEKLNSWTSKLGEVMNLLDEKEMRWMELDELLNN
jgi:ATP-binding cassette subfamily F protein uup